MVDALSNQPATPIVVRGHMAADVLVDLDAARRLAPVMRREHSLDSAAAELENAAMSPAYLVGPFV